MGKRKFKERMKQEEKIALEKFEEIGFWNMECVKISELKAERNKKLEDVSPPKPKGRGIRNIGIL